MNTIRLPERGESIMKLLVSVKDMGELEIALSSNVDIIDLKDPDKGPLAAVSPQFATIAAQIAVNGRANSPCSTLEAQSHLHPHCRHRSGPKLSLAMGELKDGPHNVFGCSFPAGFSFAKVGLAGMATDREWTQQWSSWALSLPPSVTPVMVGYADWDFAESPSLTAVVDLAIEQRVEYLLIDTFAKDGSNLFDHLTSTQLSSVLSPIRSNLAHRTQVALAGSIGIQHLPMLMDLHPEIIAVRGAVCENANRKSSVRKQLVDRLSSEIRIFCGRTQKTF